MKNFIILSLCLLAPAFLFSQTIVKGGGVVYCNGAPTHTVSINTDSEVALDTASGLWYEWNRDAIAWGKAGFRIQHLPISVAPTGAPQDKQSEVVINDVDSLYQWRGGAWRHLNKVWDNSATNEGLLGVGAGGASSSVLLSNTSGATGVTINVAGINAITETTSSNGGSITITATEVDGSVTNELQTYSHSGTSTYTNTLSNGGGSWSITGAGIAVISQTGGAVTITATEVDGSVTNELQTFASTSDATSHTLTLSNSGGSFKLVEGSGITLTTSGTGLDGIVTIASTATGVTDLTFSGTSSPVTLNSSSGTDVTFTAGGILSFSASGTNITMTATEVDGSVTNELQTYSHSGTSTYTNTLSNGGGSWSITGAGIAVISQTAGAITVTATEVDGSTTNELQTLASTSDATSHTITLSNSGGSIKLVEGANITLTTSGTGLDGIVTIAATSGGGSDLTFSGTSSPVTLNSSSGTDVTFTAGGILSFSATGTNITMTATEVDGSTTNELQTYSHAGTSTYTNTLSNGGGSWSITGAGIAVISQTAGAITVTATEVDGSTTNELQTLASTSDATSHTLTLSNSGGSIKLVEGSGITLTTSGTGLDGIVTIAATTQVTDLTFSGTSSPVTLNSSSGTDVTFTAGGILSFSATGTNITMTATEVDGSTTNELQTYSHSGTSTYTNTLSNGGGSWSITGAGIAVISQTAGAITVTATEVDGSTTNELQTYSHAGTTTYTNTLSNGGGSWSITGAGIAVISQTAGAITVTATEVDGSVTNEGTLGVGAGGASSSVLLSNTSGATGVTINVAGINAITETTSSNGGSITITATEVDGSTTNELQTFASTSDATSHTLTLSNSGGSFKLVEGSGITLTTSGTGLGGIVTIAATTQATDLTFSGTSSPVTLNSSSGTDVTFTAGGILSFSASGTNITMTATEVDGSTTNELQTYSHAGTTTYTNTLSNGGGSWSITGAGIAVISQTAGAVTVTATEVDGSTTNELQTLASTSDATSHTVTLSNSGGSFKLVEGSNITLTTSGTGLDGIVTIASTGGSVTEGQGIDITSSVVNLGAPDTTTSLVTSNRYINIDNDAAFIQFSTSRELFDDGAAASPVLRFINQQSGSATEGAGITFLEKNGATLLSQSTIFNSASGLQFQTTKDITAFASGMIINQADSIQFQTVATSTKIPAVVGINSVGTIKQIVGTSNGQVLTWQSGGWIASAGSGGSGDISQGGNSFTAPFVIGTNDNFSVSLEQNGTTAVTIGTDKNVTMVSAVAATNTITNRLILQTNSTGTAANNFGTGILFQAETSTTDNRDQASIGSYWPNSTEGSQTGGLSFKLPQGGGALTEVMKLDRSGDVTGMLSIGSTTPAQITNTAFFNNTAYIFGNSANAVTLGGFTGAVELARTSANTSTPVDFTVDATSSGVAANGFGTSILLQAESSTTVGRDLGSIQGIWTNATDASRTADLVINLSNSATVAERTRFYAAGGFITQATGIIKGTGSATGSNTSSTLRLWNPTASTGDTWYLNSKDNGEFGLFSGNANEVVRCETDGTLTSMYDMKITNVTGTPTTVIGRDGTGQVGTVTLGTDVTLSSGELPLWNSNDAGSITSLTTTALADVTGLSFAVTANKKYEFRAVVKYSAAATTTGSAWSINGPAGTVQLHVMSGLTNSTTFDHWQNAVNTLLASASSVYTSGNIAIITGIVEPTAGGTYIIRGGTEVGASAITVQGVSNINWREIK